MENTNKRFIIVGLLALSLTVISFDRVAKTGIKKETTAKCLIISDIHFSPLFGYSLNDTTLKRKLEWSSFDEWIAWFEKTPAQMALNASLLYKDANYAVLQSALFNMKKRLPNPAFIIIAGDFIWHGAKPADSVLKKKTILFIARLFKENFPNSLIIPALGNNDTYGPDYALQDPKFLNDFANAWEPNLPNLPADSLKANGYYTCETGNLRLVVINTAAVCTGQNNKKEATEMFKWLHFNLSNANGKNIWIVMHIPPGINGFSKKNLWDAEYLNEFVTDIVKFAPAVKFMIAGHIHLNDFRVVYNNSKFPAPVAFMRIVPSICSNHGNNPSFEVAEFTTSNGSVVNETNWFLNLAAIPKEKSTQQLTWADTLRLPSPIKFGVENAANFSKLIDNIRTDKTGQMLKSYADFYDVGTKADSTLFMNHGTFMNYLKADSLKEK